MLLLLGAKSREALASGISELNAPCVVSVPLGGTAASLGLIIIGRARSRGVGQRERFRKGRNPMPQGRLGALRTRVPKV